MGGRGEGAGFEAVGRVAVEVEEGEARLRAVFGEAEGAGGRGGRVGIGDCEGLVGLSRLWR